MTAEAAITREARREHLADLLAFAESACAALHPDDAFAVRLAVEEVCVNVIAHGYAGLPPGPVALSIAVGPETVVVRVEDRARPFDPVDAPAPDLAATCDDRPIGGLGIHLVRQLMDEVRHEARAEGGNLLTMIRRRTR